MKHQQVSVDYWAMGKAMVTYGVLTVLVWVMLRMMGAVFTLPRRLRAQHENMEATLKELQSRYPDLNITEEDLKNAEKDLEELTKENNIADDTETKDSKEVQAKQDKQDKPTTPTITIDEPQISDESKKTI